MTLLQWYNALNTAMMFTACIMGLCTVWFVIEASKTGHPDKPGLVLAALAMIILAIMIPRAIIESKICPSGQCPNCNHSVTAKYCEDCGWQNDSYFEQTDRN